MLRTTSTPTARGLDPFPARIVLGSVKRLPLSVYRVPAGFPSPASDYIEDGLDLNELLVRNAPASFLFTVQGRYMEEAGILHGDRLVVDRSLTPIHEDIVVAVVDGEFVLRRLHLARGRCELRAQDGKTPAVRISEEVGLHVWGVVHAVVRRYRC